MEDRKILYVQQGCWPQDVEGSEIKIGDKVRYSSEYLTGIYAMAKPEWNENGIITDINRHGIATVAWSHGKPSRVNIRNLEKCDSTNERGLKEE